MGLQKQVLSIPISQGLDQKTDDKQVLPGKALILENARFQKTGRLSKRFGLVLIDVSTNTGSDLNDYTVSTVVADNEFMAVKTSNGCYSYSVGDSQWFRSSRFTTSPTIESDFVMKNLFDQKGTDCDVTSDGTHIAYVANQDKLGSSLKYCVVVLEDTSTGSVKSAVINTFTAGTMALQRVIVVKSGGFIRVHVFFFSSGGISRIIYNENLDIVDVETVIATAVSTSQIDVCKDSTTIYFARMTTTSLRLISYTFAGVQINSLSDTVTVGISNISGSASGMCITTTASNLHVSWVGGIGFCIKGFTKALVASITEFSSAAAARYGRVSICSTSLGLSYVIYTTSSFVTTVGTITFTTTYSPTPGDDYYRVIPSTQMFTTGGKDYIILSGLSTINASFYLFNITDKYIVQSFSRDLYEAQQYIGNQPVNMLSKSIVLSGMVRTSTSRKYRVNTNDASDDFFSTFGLTKTVLNFSEDYSSNSRVKVGPRIYQISGSVVEFDKENPHENGFIIYPELSAVTPVITVANPNVASKTFSYICVYEYYDSNGQLTQSVPSLAVSSGLTNANTSSITVSAYPPVASLKTGIGLSANYSRAMSVVFYRTQNNGSVYYKLSEAIITNNTGAVTVSISDTTSDASLSNNATLYTTGEVLANDPAPVGKFATSGGNRIFIGGLEERDEVAFSKKQLFGESVNFSDFFRIRVASGTGADKTPIGALGYMDGKLIIFRGQSIYFIQGDGPTETGIGGFSEPEVISSDVGCSEPRSILNTPQGIMFKSRKGIYLLTRGLGVEYIGASVEDYNTENVVASLVSDKFNEARFYLSSGDCIVYNYLFESWSTFKDQTMVDADAWQGSPVGIISNAVFQETENTYLDNGPAGFYSMKFTSPWLKLDLVQGYLRVYRLFIIGDYKSPHTLKCRIYIDYDESYYEEYDLVLDTTDQPQYQFQIHQPIQKVESMKFELFDADHESASNGEAYDLSNLQVEIGVKAGGFKLADSKSY